jgi:hypothetical protein
MDVKEIVCEGVSGLSWLRIRLIDLLFDFII